MSCSKTPVELVVATTDPTLYDPNSKSWRWQGQMYWGVECVQKGQSVSAVPTVSKFVALDNTPAIWDFCNSKGCSSNTDYFLLVFTFNPHSSQVSDYLQYVVDINNNKVQTPKNGIKDGSGKEIKISILEVSKLSQTPYVEIWIGSGLGLGAIKKSASNSILWIVLGLVLLFLLGLGGYFLWHREHKISIPEGNIG